MKGATTNSHLDFAGDNLAINFINTRRRIEGELTDTLQSDNDVKLWLRKMRLSVTKGPLPFPDGLLLQQARELRDISLAAVEQQKLGRKPSLLPLNRFLANAPSRTEISTDESGRIKITRIYGKDTPEAILAPVAEAVADLLAHGDFDLIRHCEGEACVMWFYDRTKGHRRRWCSSTGCGNRAKVAAFRARSKHD